MGSPATTNTRRIPRPSGALAVAFLALFVALGGSSYAVSQINGSKIRRATIAGSKLRKNTITGTQVNESKLGQVPSARTALSATIAADATHAADAGHAVTADHATEADHATTADRIGSLTTAQIQQTGTVVPFDVRMTNTEPDRTLVAAGPFTISATCKLASNGTQNLYVVNATTSQNDAAADASDIFGTEHHDPNFDVGDTFQITLDQESGVNVASGPLPFSATLWSRGGTSLTLQGALGGHLFSDNLSDQVQCTFAGYAIVGG